MFLQKAMDPAFWQSVREGDLYAPLRAELDALWQEDLTTEILPVTYRDYQLYFTTGDRAIYEKRYFHRRRMLAGAAILSLVYPEKTEYSDRLSDLIFLILSEFTWTLPAHQPDGDRPYHDQLALFACETGMALAEIDTLLGDRIPPFLRTMIREEVDRRIINPYLDPPRRYWWFESTNNWSAVCAGAIGVTVMRLRPELFETIRPRLEKTLEYYLSGFGDDGFCLEGLSYWNYGFGFFVTYADALREFSGGKYDYFAREKVKRIAMFPESIFLSGRAAVSFSDSPRMCIPNPTLNHFLSREYPDAVRPMDCRGSVKCDHCGRWCLFVRAFVWLDERAQPVDAPSDVYQYAPDAQWYIRKTPSYGFAAKGGHNAESHNHNDIGSFIIAAGGKQIISDYGPPKYCRDYFNSKRYTFTLAASRGHDLPLFCLPDQITEEAQQKVGAAFRAAHVEADRDHFSLDLAPAYANPAVRRAHRAFTLGENTVTLTDTFDTDTPVTERLTLLDEPTVTKDGFTVCGVTCKVTAKIRDTRVSKFKEENETSSERFRAYFIDYVLAEGETAFTLTVDLSSAAPL